MNEGSVDQATSVIYNADIRPKIKELVSAGEAVLALLDGVPGQESGKVRQLNDSHAESAESADGKFHLEATDVFKNGKSLGSAGGSDSVLNLIEKMEGVAYRAIRDSIAFRWYSITGKHVTYDDVEYWMPKSVDEFDVDQMIKDMAATPDCLHFIHNTFLDYLQRVPSKEEIDYWLGNFSVGEAGEYRLRHALNQEHDNPTGKAVKL